MSIEKIDALLAQLQELDERKLTSASWSRIEASADRLTLRFSRNIRFAIEQAKTGDPSMMFDKLRAGAEALKDIVGELSRDPDYSGHVQDVLVAVGKREI
jgi:hypothetical protein